MPDVLIWKSGCIILQDACKSCGYPTNSCCCLCLLHILRMDKAVRFQLCCQTCPKLPVSPSQCPIVLHARISLHTCKPARRTCNRTFPSPHLSVPRAWAAPPDDLPSAYVERWGHPFLHQQQPRTFSVRVDTCTQTATFTSHHLNLQSLDFIHCSSRKVSCLPPAAGTRAISYS